MSKITLNDLSHSYLEKQNSDADWALRGINLDWQNGGAYALLGPSGCGKTIDVYNKPKNLISARVFSDPPINISSIKKIGDTFR